MIWKGIDTPNWITMKEPKAPRSVVEMVMDEIKALNMEFAQAFDQREEDLIIVQLKKINPSNPKKGADKTATLFEKKLHFYTDVEFNRNSILTQIIKLCLKGYLEFARKKTFSKNGFNQMQLDIYFMRVVLCNLVQGADTILNALLDEILVNSMERCVEPTPLDQQTIIGFCDVKLKKVLAAIQGHPSTPPHNSPTQSNADNNKV